MGTASSTPAARPTWARNSPGASGDLSGLISLLATGYVASSPAIASDVSVYCGSNDFYIYAFNGTTGSVAWKYRTGGTVESSPAIVDDIVIVGSSDSVLYALHKANGTIKWSFAATGGLRSSPSVVNNAVFVGSEDGVVYSIANQTMVLSHGKRSTSLPRDQARGHLVCGLYGFSNVCTGQQHGAASLELLDAQLHLELACRLFRWRYFFGSSDGVVYLLTASGVLCWTYPTAYQVLSSPTVSADGLSIFVGSNDNHVYAWTPPRGKRYGVT